VAFTLVMIAALLDDKVDLPSPLDRPEWPTLLESGETAAAMEAALPSPKLKKQLRQPLHPHGPIEWPSTSTSITRFPSLIRDE